MSGHIKWTDVSYPDPEWAKLRAAAGARAIRYTRTWVKGYITALEDVIKDLEPQRYGYLNDQDAERLADLIMKDVQTSLASAQETLDTINKIMEEPSDSEQGQGGAVRSGPGE